MASFHHGSCSTISGRTSLIVSPISTFDSRIVIYPVMGLLPDAYTCGLRMRRECRERFPSHRLQRKPLVSDPGMHHGTCVTHVPWCMSGSLVRGGGENVPGIPGACAIHNFTYLARGPLVNWAHQYPILQSFIADYIINHINHHAGQIWTFVVMWSMKTYMYTIVNSWKYKRHSKL